MVRFEHSGHLLSDIGPALVNRVQILTGEDVFECFESGLSYIIAPRSELILYLQKMSAMSWME